MNLNIYGTKILSALKNDSDNDGIDIGAIVDLRKVSLQKRINFSTNSTGVLLLCFGATRGCN